MNCNQVIGQVPQIIRRELSADDRVVLIEHIKSCDTCRSEYHKFLKLVYSVDFKVVQPEPELEEHLIDISQFEIKQPKSMGLIWIAAAVFIILTISTIVLTDVWDNSNVVKSDQFNTVSQKLSDENWQELTNILGNRLMLHKIGDEKIPLDLLLTKLDALEQSGVNKFKLAMGQEDNLSREIKVGVMKKKLQSYHRYKAEISVREISKYLSLI